jgi:hypothetical protein
MLIYWSWVQLAPAQLSPQAIHPKHLVHQQVGKMPRSRKENKIFTESFRNSQKGHAVWPRVLSDDLAPGACGYMNHDGDWVTIIQLTDSDAINKADLEPLEGMSIIDDAGGSTWDPKLSESVRGKAVSVYAGAK